ncbi:ACT domain-containing protein [Actinomadura rupiterrae]|uniref:ACT domain-containing protein n=1 Tax=Actinomadura rupiterrae TaxID=559627 RepID=UPI0020A2B640|nr:ACT domain-containing protein [Actinomadura rupiterrae]MCP2339908.1 hypothetical protein [Actinomadura rupiterrae]
MTVAQTLGVVPNQFVLEHLPNSVFPEDDEWVALVRAPEGLTVVREAPPSVEADRWVGFYGGATAHGLDTPGMLAAIISPLAEARISVFVASTYHADLVLVPEYKLDVAKAVLQEAGHRIQG